MGTLFIRDAYYSRLLVPLDLRPFLDSRREIGRNLRTSNYRDAKLRAARWEGRIALLFGQLRQQGTSMKLDQIKRLVQHYLDASLEEAEKGRLNGNLSDDAEQETTELAITDLLEATQEQLRRSNFKKIEDESEKLLQFPQAHPLENLGGLPPSVP